MAQNPHLLTDHQKFVTGVYVCGPYGCAKFGANLTASTAEKVEFLKKFKMADGCRFENRKIGISLNATFRQTDFDEIWLGDAC